MTISTGTLFLQFVWMVSEPGHCLIHFKDFWPCEIIACHIQGQNIPWKAAGLFIQLSIYIIIHYSYIFSVLRTLPGKGVFVISPHLMKV